MALIKSISGIRGIFGHTLNKEVASSYSISFAQNQPKGTILLSQDTRPHGKILYNSILDTLINNGFDVLDCGIWHSATGMSIHPVVADFFPLWKRFNAIIPSTIYC